MFWVGADPMKTMKLAGNITSTLWLFLGLCLTCSAALAEGIIPIDAASRFIDVASKQDVVWLSLAVALAAIGVIFWLVKIIVKQQADSIKAITTLCDKLENRPCFKDRDN